MNKVPLNRPDYLPKKKLEIPRSRLEIYCEFIAAGALIASIIYLFIAWPDLPERIPSHFGASGKPDGWAGKHSLLLLPGVAGLIYLMLTIFQRFPQIYNYPWKITEENRQRQYHLARQLLTALKAEIVCLFSYMAWQTSEVALGKSQGLGFVFLPIALVIIFGTIVLYFVSAYRSK